MIKKESLRLVYVESKQMPLEGADTTEQLLTPEIKAIKASVVQNKTLHQRKTFQTSQQRRI